MSCATDGLSGRSRHRFDLAGDGGEAGRRERFTGKRHHDTVLFFGPCLAGEIHTVGNQSYAIISSSLRVRQGNQNLDPGVTVY